MGNSPTVSSDVAVNEKMNKIVTDTTLEVFSRNSSVLTSITELSNKMKIGGIVVGSSIGGQSITSKIDLQMLLDSKTNDQIGNELINTLMKSIESNNNVTIPPDSASVMINDISKSYKTNFSIERVISMLNVISASNEMDINGIVVGTSVGSQDISSNVIMKVVSKFTDDVMDSIKKTELYNTLISIEERSRLNTKMMYGMIVIIIIIVIICVLLAIPSYNTGTLVANKSSTSDSSL